MNKYLTLSWSISRGRDTYGYNICRLDDNATGKRYRCMGGGYDMVGTVVAQWLKADHMPALLANADKIGQMYGCSIARDAAGSAVYVRVDGACGLECVQRIAEAIGISITGDYNIRKRCAVGFFVSVNKSEVTA